jgi:hypothetical protein
MISPSLRLPAEEGQMLTAAVQPPRFRSPIHDRHTTYIGTGQCRRQRSLVSNTSLRHDSLAASQDSDDELGTLLRLEEQQIPGTRVSIYCGTSVGKPRPYVPAQSIPVRPRPVASRHQSNSEAGRTAFRVARHAEGLPHLGTGLPALQSFPPHSYSSGRLHTAGSPFPLRPRRAPSIVSRLHVLLHCKPAYVLNETGCGSTTFSPSASTTPVIEPPATPPPPPATQTTRSGRNVRFPARFNT